jgi:tRNA A-37 threonylcarbamoyl transferase component Bud32
LVTVFPVASVGIRSNVARPREQVANAPQDDGPCDDIAPLVGGRFAVERILGRGGCGLVVAARHVALDQRVAIKFLLPKALKSRDAVERFAREARTSARLRSEHTVRVYDVGVLDNGAPFMVMEYLEGTDLAEVMSDGALPIGDAVTYVLQACEALAEAHALGIVHRDLKPANLFLAESACGARSVKVLDFGISKVLEPWGSPNEKAVRTDPSFILGSPGFMSPEQMRAASDVDARTDIWSLGAILYQALTGRPAFDVASIPEVFSSVLLADPKDILAHRPEVPKALAGVVTRCLQKNRDARFADVTELADALVAFAPEEAKHYAERARAMATASADRETSPTLRMRLSSRRARRFVAQVGTMAEKLETRDVSMRLPTVKRPWLWVAPVAIACGALAALLTPRAAAPIRATASITAASNATSDVARRALESSDDASLVVTPTRIAMPAPPPRSDAAHAVLRAPVNDDDGQRDEAMFGRRK